jgi:hypothetical protein
VSFSTPLLFGYASYGQTHCGIGPQQTEIDSITRHRVHVGVYPIRAGNAQQCRPYQLRHPAPSIARIGQWTDTCVETLLSVLPPAETGKKDQLPLSRYRGFRGPVCIKATSRRVHWPQTSRVFNPRFGLHQ